MLHLWSRVWHQINRVNKFTQFEQTFKFKNLDIGCGSWGQD
jgi:pterin-4a-carbinolamine dehydratase